MRQLLGERLGQVLDDVDLTDDPDEVTRVVDDRDIPIAPRLHEDDGVADGLIEVEGLRLGGHQGLDGLGQVDVLADQPTEDVALREDARRAGPTGRTRTPNRRCPIRWMARMHSARDVPGGTVTGWPAAESAQSLLCE